jgi:nucleoside-diphosphate-sugar epimerase
MKILICGTGFVGLNIAGALLARGHLVRPRGLAARRAAGFRRTRGSAESRPRVCSSSNEAEDAESHVRRSFESSDQMQDVGGQIHARCPSSLCAS